MVELVVHGEVIYQCQIQDLQYGNKFWFVCLSFSISLTFSACYSIIFLITYLPYCLPQNLSFLLFGYLCLSVNDLPKGQYLSVCLLHVCLFCLSYYQWLSMPVCKIMSIKFDWCRLGIYLPYYGMVYILPMLTFGNSVKKQN